MKKTLYFLGFLLLAFLFTAKIIFAADIFCNSDKLNVTENQTFTVNVSTSTGGIYINNAEALISFPKDLLEVESVNNNGSIFSMWVEQPIFSNTLGTISFNGGVPTPGFSGSKGKIISILFKAKKMGTAQISFSSANIYANDGLGTDITSGKTGVNINIAAYKGPETNEEVMVSDKLPSSPIITSTDMPDPEVWYSLNKATFSWDLPHNVIAVQALINNSPNSIPNVTYAPPIEEKTITDLSDGVRYIHVRFKNNSGWGKTAHRKIKIDTTGPINLDILSSTTPDDLVALKITSQDATSGVSKYKISIDGVFVSEVVANGNPTNIILPPEKAGNHEISVIAYDKAGNLSEKIITVEFPKILSPEITKYPESITKREKIEIAGTSYPNTDVRIWLQLEGENAKSYMVKSLDDGTFSFVSDPIETTGLASFWAEAVRSKDAVSAPSEKFFTQVNKTEFVKMSLLTIEILSVSIPTLLLLIILLYIAFHAYHKLRRMRRRLMTDLEDTESEAHKIFKIIKEDVRQSIKIFKSKDIKEKLSDDDKEVIDSLSKDIEEAEEYFTKRIKNIEKKDL